jgi:hypothetical protein
VFRRLAGCDKTFDAFEVDHLFTSFFCSRKSESSYLRTGFLTFPLWRQARKKDLNPVRTYRPVQVLFVFTSCGPLAPPLTRAEKNLAFACFRPIIRNNPSREAKIDTSAFLQAWFCSKLHFCNFGHKKTGATVYERTDDSGLHVVLPISKSWCIIN